MWIGSVKVPENRDTTKQLLFTWAQLINEVDNIKPLLRNLDNKMVEQSFVTQAQEISMHLSGAMKEKGFKKKCNTEIYTGRPASPTGWFNARVAQVMHVYFDEPTYKPKGSHPCIECPGEA